MSYDPRKPYKYKILKGIEATWRTPYVRVRRGVYPTFERKFDLPEVQHTDGIGTKGDLHWKYRTFRAAVQDALAMNLNDLLMVGARAYTLQNHIVLPKDDHKAILEIVSMLSFECKKRKIAMTGGETSIHNTMRGMDLSITVSGFIKKPFVNRAKVGDILVGIPSSGLHSNGITKARAMLGARLSKSATTPTRIYFDEVYPLLLHVHGLMHITGGAFAKLKDILGENDAVIDAPLRPQRVFGDLYAAGVSSKEMLSTFNCGTGMVLFVSKASVAKVVQIRGAKVIGHVTSGKGAVRIQSPFDGKTILL